MENPWTLSREEYVKRLGAKCPSCESSAIATIDSLEYTGAGSVAQNLRCRVCGAEWCDYYDLVTYGMNTREDNALTDFIENGEVEDPSFYKLKTSVGERVFLVELTQRGKHVVVAKLPNGEWAFFVDSTSIRLERIADKGLLADIEVALAALALAVKLEG